MEGEFEGIVERRETSTFLRIFHKLGFLADFFLIKREATKLRWAGRGAQVPVLPELTGSDSIVYTKLCLNGTQKNSSFVKNCSTFFAQLPLDLYTCQIIF
jgi:hypothetical protein